MPVSECLSSRSEKQVDLFSGISRPDLSVGRLVHLSCSKEGG